MVYQRVFMRSDLQCIPGVADTRSHSPSTITVHRFKPSEIPRLSYSTPLLWLWLWLCEITIGIGMTQWHKMSFVSCSKKASSTFSPSAVDHNRGNIYDQLKNYIGEIRFDYIRNPLIGSLDTQNLVKVIRFTDLSLFYNFFDVVTNVVTHVTLLMSRLV